MPSFRTLLNALVVVAFAVPAAAPQAMAVPGAKILTASSDGTYAALAESLRDSLKGVLDLEVAYSAGSGENVLMVSMGEADLAMVQMDYLAVLAKNPKFKEMLSEIQVVAPLHLEEIHIVVRKKAGIKSFKDFKRKLIGVGPGASGSYFSASLLLGQHGIDVSKGAKVKVFQRTPDRAIFLIANKRLDAMFFTGGQPVGLFSKIGRKDGKKLKLLGVPATVMASYKKAKLPYWPATIPKSAYSWSKEDVNTVATPCLLITSVSTPPDVIDVLVKGLFTNKDALKAKHPKWGQVSLKLAKKILAMGTLNFHPSAAKYISTAK